MVTHVSCSPDNVLQREPGDADGLYHLQERVGQQQPLVIHDLITGKQEVKRKGDEDDHYLESLDGVKGHHHS